MAFAHKDGYATLLPLVAVRLERQQHLSPGCAHGVVFEVSSREVEILQKRERGYNLEPVLVEPIGSGDGDDGGDPSGRAEDSSFEALAFVSSRWQRLARPVAPRQWYIDLVLSGAEARQLPETYLAWLQAEANDACSDQLTHSEADTFLLGSPRFATRSRTLRVVFASLWVGGFVGLPVAAKLLEASKTDR